MKRVLLLSALVASICLTGCKQDEPTDRGKSISVDPNTYELAATGGEFTVTVKSTAAWSATSNQAWVTIKPNAGQGDAYVTITVAAGESGTANVLFSNGEGTATLVITRGEGTTPPDPSTPTGALKGKFSVSATKQVRFSQGNLQYQASTSTWRFAEHQCDVVGIGYGQTDEDAYCYIGGTVQNSDNRQISASYAGWIDLFGWGTGNNPTNTSTDNADYATFTDWGINKISNGGNTANQWRTLTYDEWDYLLSTRANAKNLRGQATVNGITGYVFLADGFVVPSGLSFTANPNNWTTNVYTSSDWAKMEAVGAVFLPAAGNRYGTGVGSVGYYGYYWSSAPKGENYTYNLGFGSDGASMMFNYRNFGQSVRLVQDF